MSKRPFDPRSQYRAGRLDESDAAPGKQGAGRGRSGSESHIGLPRWPAQGADEHAGDTIETLNKENLRLRRELWVQKREAEKNEVIFRRFQALELALLDSEALPELVERMIRMTRETLGVDEVTLMLDDPDHEIRNLVVSNELSLPPPPAVWLVVDPSDGQRARSRLEGPWLGPFSQDHAPLFSGRKHLASVALLPLRAQRCRLGTLHLGSTDPDRFTRAHAVDFVHHLASVASMCIQNGINHERLVVDGHTDPLTRWFNRRYLDLRLPREVARAVRYREPLCGLLLDIDHFKSINDRHGHQVGDRVLREIADRARAELRGTDLAIRYGGEEFLVLLICTGQADAWRVAERIRRRVESDPFRIGGGRCLSVTLSGGIAELPARDAASESTDSGMNLLRCADTALYRAKAEGRNRILCHRAV